MVNNTQNKDLSHNDGNTMLGVVFCSECNTRIETYNQDHMRWVELIDTKTDTYLCSSECRIKMERREEGF